MKRYSVSRRNFSTASVAGIAASALNVLPGRVSQAADARKLQIKIAGYDSGQFVAQLAADASSSLSCRADELASVFRTSEDTASVTNGPHQRPVRSCVGFIVRRICN
jgi:hypothetical protein